MPLIVIVLAAMQSDDIAQDVRDLYADVQRALARCGLTPKDVEFYTGYNARRWSERINLTTHKPLDFAKLGKLPRAFWRAFRAVQAEREGEVIFERQMVKLIIQVEEGA